MAKKVTKSTKTSPKAKTVAKAAAKTVAAAPVKGQTVLKQICAKVGIDPKTARRILRKRMRSDVPQIAKFHTIKQRWVQSPKDAQTIESVLREYAKAA